MEKHYGNFEKLDQMEFMQLNCPGETKDPESYI
jgi:hypothetical protein